MKKKSIPSRFLNGETVMIRDVIATRRKGQLGRIIETRPSKWDSESLDKYVVLFADGDQEEFWDIQLDRHSREIAAH
jgi:hypothetical protein